MFSFNALNIHEAMQTGLDHLLHSGVEEESRNGAVLVAPGPVACTYLNPREHVLLSAVRDANPWLHMFDALWCLSGGKDIGFLGYFAKNMLDYSDDGLTSWGGYGWRWRNFFGYDQIEEVVEELQSNPASRRCNLQMWNAWPEPGSFIQNYDMNRHNSALQDCDLHVATSGGRDVPCNLNAIIDVRGGRVNMTTLARSHDVWWGAYGANPVQFSLLLEYLSMRIGAPMGTYTQISHNFHCYTDRVSREKLQAAIFDCAALLDGPPLPATGPALDAGFDEDLARFMPWARSMMQNNVMQGDPALATAFMSTVAMPMFKAWWMRKNKQPEQCDAWVADIQAPDWKRAAEEWISRRVKA
jgi:hypothetical protein